MVVDTYKKSCMVIILICLSLITTLSSLSIPHTIYDNSELKDLGYGWPINFVVQDSSRYSLGGDGPPLPYVWRIASPWENPTTFLPVPFLLDLIFWCGFFALLGWLIYRISKGQR